MMIKNQNFGIEIELTGITRQNAAKVIANYDAYIGLYNLAMSPSGGRGTFVDTYNNLTSIIKNCQSKLDNLLT